MIHGPCSCVVCEGTKVTLNQSESCISYINQEHGGIFSGQSVWKMTLWPKYLEYPGTIWRRQLTWIHTSNLHVQLGGVAPPG